MPRGIGGTKSYCKKGPFSRFFIKTNFGFPWFSSILSNFHLVLVENLEFSQAFTSPIVQGPLMDVKFNL